MQSVEELAAPIGRSVDLGKVGNRFFGLFCLEPVDVRPVGRGVRFKR
jgi:hypothetical protein